MEAPAQRSILVINPNSTEQMTTALKPLINPLNLATTRFEYFTAPSGVSSINDEDDAAESASACWPSLKSQLASHNGFLVCCYSQHPLVAMIRKEAIQQKLHGTVVTGIFEASVASCLQLLDVDAKFGIVSTGQQWEDILEEAVADLLGLKSSPRYAGTETTGLNADELHTTPKSEVDQRMKDATKRLLDKGAKAICLGCAGMAGMDKTVREACIETLGEVDGKSIKIIDGVISGALYLEGALRAGL